jgi:hypothetical protein
MTLFANATAKAPRRIALGAETYSATNAAVGTVGSPEGVYMAFNSPIAINPKEWVAICMKNVGTVVSTTGVVVVAVMFDSYWI